MFCEISQDENQRQFDVIAADLIYRSENKKPVKNLKSYLKEQYPIFLEKSKDEEGDPDQLWALTSLMAIPDHLNLIQAVDSELKDSVFTDKLLEDIIKFNATYNKLPLEQRYKKLLKEIGQKEIPPKVKAAREKNYAYSLKQTEAAKEKFKAQLTLSSFNLKKALSPFSSTGIETTVEDGWYTNVPKEDEKFYYDIIRGIINAANEFAIDYNEVSYGNNKNGFSLVAININQLAEDQLNPSTQKALKEGTTIWKTDYEAKEYKDPSTGEIKKIKAGQRLEDVDGELKKKAESISAEDFRNKYFPGVALVIADKDGKFLYFDNEGNVTTQEKGRLVYTNMRKTYGDKIYGLENLNNIINIEKDRLIKSGEFNEEEFNEYAKNLRRERAKQIALISRTREYLIKNPDESLQLDILSAMPGVYNKGWHSSSEFNLSDTEIDSIDTSLNTTSEKKSGFSYIEINNIPIELRASKIKDIPGLIENMSQMLVRPLKFEGEDISNERKFNYVKQFLINKYGSFAINFDTESDVLSLTINGESIDLSEISEEELIKAFQNANLYLSINRDLTSDKKRFEYAEITDNNVTFDTTIPYKKWLLNYVKMNAMPAKDGKVYRLNPYFIFDMNVETLSKVDPIYAEQFNTKKDGPNEWLEGNDSENPLECYG